MGETRTYLGGRGNYQIVSALGKRVLKRMVDLIEEEGWSKCGSLVTVWPDGMYCQALVRPKYKAGYKPLDNRPVMRIARERIEDLVEEVEWHLRKGWKVSGGVYKNYYGTLTQEIIKE